MPVLIPGTLCIHHYVAGETLTGHYVRNLEMGRLSGLHEHHAVPGSLLEGGKRAESQEM